MNQIRYPNITGKTPEERQKQTEHYLRYLVDQLKFALKNRTESSGGLSLSDIHAISGKDGKNGISPHVGNNGNWFLGDNDTGIPATGPAGGQGLPGPPGKDGIDGKDGYTPVKGVDYFDGLPGADGKPGEDGYTPIKWVDYFDGLPGKDGADGQPGKDGYTPVKGVDYFDGLPGKDGKDGSPGADGQPGKDGKTPQVGVDYWTDADKAEIIKEVSKGIEVPTKVSELQNDSGFQTLTSLKNTYFIPSYEKPTAFGCTNNDDLTTIVTKMPNYSDCAFWINATTFPAVYNEVLVKTKENGINYAYGVVYLQKRYNVVSVQFDCYNRLLTLVNRWTSVNSYGWVGWRVLIPV